MSYPWKKNKEPKRKKYAKPKITAISVKNAPDFLAKTDEEILQFFKERISKEEKAQ
jgi:hypothetical protein